MSRRCSVKNEATNGKTRNKRKKPKNTKKNKYKPPPTVPLCNTISWSGPAEDPESPHLERRGESETSLVGGQR
jgi:hypothetical protein